MESMSWPINNVLFASKYNDDVLAAAIEFSNVGLVIWAEKSTAAMLCTQGVQCYAFEPEYEHTFGHRFVCVQFQPIQKPVQKLKELCSQTIFVNSMTGVEFLVESLRQHNGNISPADRLCLNALVFTKVYEGIPALTFVPKVDKPG